MSSSMDKPRGAPASTPGYETRDVNVRGVLNSLVYLSLVLVFTFLVSWGVFRYFSAQQANLVSTSPFSGTRPLPPNVQLQVNPRQDFLKFHAEQEKSLESYAWEDRAAGTVRIPIEQAMELLLQKGLPVASQPSSPVEAEKTAPKRSVKP